MSRNRTPLLLRFGSDQTALKANAASPARRVLLTRQHGNWNVEHCRMAYDIAGAVKWAVENAPTLFATNEIPWLERGCEP